jgi:hypothetical protein
MREQLILSLVVVGAAACAAQPSRTTLTSSTTNAKAETYACNDQTVVRDSHAVFAGSDERLALGWQDGDGDHFVAWPTSATKMETVEYVMPADPRDNAIQRIYDTSKGKSRADWRMVKENVCTAKRGYTSALAMFSEGKSFDTLATELDISRKDAEKLVHDAMITVQKRYFRER